MGYPLKGFKDTDDREGEQEDKVKQFCLNNWDKTARNYGSKELGSMEYYYTSLYMIIAVIIRQVLIDLSLAVGSCLFIFVFMCIQTQSLWVTSWSIFSIVSGFVITLIIYR